MLEARLIHALALSLGPLLTILLHLAVQQPEWGKIKFPGHLRIDYVRVYQKKGQKNVGCDPPDMPTSKYINSHMDLYTNPNLTTYRDAMKQSNFTLPRNRLAAGGCS
ncbi:Beta-glucan synthesis-associated protein KRE6 [Rhodotorula toruloides]|nr:Beta-glucan synthesis-associated protein KRE6 [Rhodotorula toruloides]